MGYIERNAEILAIAHEGIRKAFGGQKPPDTSKNRGAAKMAAIVAVAEMSLGELDATKNPFVKRIVDRAVEEYLEMVRKNWTVFFVFLSVLSRRFMPLWAAVFVCRIRRRAFGCQVPGEAALR